MIHGGSLTLTQSGHSGLTLLFYHQCDILQHDMKISMVWNFLEKEWLCTGLIIMLLCPTVSNRINLLPLLMIDKDTRWRDGETDEMASLQKECAKRTARQFCDSVISSACYTHHTPPVPAETGCCSCILVALMLSYIIMNSLDAMGVYGKKLCPSSVTV